MLGQSTLISYHTEANGYIFFATGVQHREIKLNTSQIKYKFFEAGTSVDNLSGGVIMHNDGQCNTDTFSVTAPGNDAPPVICGTNTGEHSKFTKGRLTIWT